MIHGQDRTPHLSSSQEKISLVESLGPLRSAATNIVAAGPELQIALSAGVTISCQTAFGLVGGGGALGLIRANDRHIDQVLGDEPNLKFVGANHLAHK